MTDFPFAIVGFDLDGTLLDTSGDLAAAVNHVVTELGLAPLARSQVIANIGGGGRRMLARSLADASYDGADIEPLYARMIDYYAANIVVETRAYDGAVAALEALTARGVRLGVATNKGQALAAKVLDALDLARWFDAVIGGDAVSTGRPKPAPDPIHDLIARCGGGPAAFVGDSRFDIAAGKAAGVATIAVAFGYADRPAADLGADAVIAHFDELVPALERLGQPTGR